MKTIREYLPHDEKETVLIQVRLPKSLIAKVKIVMKEEKVTWRALIIASLKRFLDEVKNDSERKT